MLLEPQAVPGSCQAAAHWLRLNNSDRNKRSSGVRKGKCVRVFVEVQCGPCCGLRARGAGRGPRGPGFGPPPPAPLHGFLGEEWLQDRERETMGAEGHGLRAPARGCSVRPNPGGGGTSRQQGQERPAALGKGPKHLLMKTRTWSEAPPHRKMPLDAAPPCKGTQPLVATPALSGQAEPRGDAKASGGTRPEEQASIISKYHPQDTDFFY